MPVVVVVVAVSDTLLARELAVLPVHLAAALIAVEAPEHFPIASPAFLVPAEVVEHTSMSAKADPSEAEVDTSVAVEYQPSHVQNNPVSQQVKPPYQVEVESTVTSLVYKLGCIQIGWTCCSGVEMGCIDLLLLIGVRLGRAVRGVGVSIVFVELVCIEVLKRRMLSGMVVESSIRYRCVCSLVLEDDRKSVVLLELVVEQVIQNVSMADSGIEVAAGSEVVAQMEVEECIAGVEDFGAVVLVAELLSLELVRFEAVVPVVEKVSFSVGVLFEAADLAVIAATFVAVACGEVEDQLVVVEMLPVAQLGQNHHTLVEAYPWVMEQG